MSKSFVKSASIYVIFNSINAAFPFFILPILTRHLTPADYGITANYFVLLNVLAPIISLSVSGGIVRLYIDTKSELDKSQLVKHGLLIISAIFFLVSLLIMLTGQWLGPLFEIGILWLLLCCFNVWLQSVVDIQMGLYRIQEKPVKFGMVALANTLLNILFTCLLVIWLNMKWQGRIIGGVMGTFLVAVFTLSFLLYKERHYKFTLERKYLVWLISFGLPLLPHTLSLWVLNSVDRIFITNFSGIGENGLYNVAYQISMILVILMTSLNNAYVPWIYRKLKENNSGSNTRISKLNIYILFSFIGITIIALLLMPLFGWFVGPKFVNAAPFLTVLLIANCIEIFYFLNGNYFFYYKDNSVIMKITLSTGLFHLVICYFLIKNYGAMGACYASLLSSSLKAICITTVAHLKYKRSIIFDLRKFI